MHSGCGVLGKISTVLVVIGALNWGLVGALQFDLVAWLFMVKTDLAVVAQVIYILVGLAGLHVLVSMFTCHCSCKK